MEQVLHPQQFESRSIDLLPQQPPGVTGLVLIEFIMLCPQQVKGRYGYEHFSFRG